MWKNIVSKLREVLQRMRLTRSIQEVAQLRDLPIDDEFYQQIAVWKDIYKGYHKDWHDVEIKTINGSKKHKKESLNMPKIIAQEMAMLVFNERCEINISDNGLQENIEEVLEDNMFNVKFQHYLEYQFALGGMVIKPFMNTDTNKIQLAYVTADNFIPISWDNKNIREAVFPFQTTKGDYKYTHLEWHLWEDTTYVVKNELYKVEKKSSDLGKKVPLSELYPDLDEEVRINNLELPMFVYFSPATANHIDTSSPLGVPLFSHALGSMKAIDDVFDSFNREFRLGKRRIIVPTSAVSAVPDENGMMRRFFDSDDEVYEAMDIAGIDDNKIHDNTVTLRVQEHVDAINSHLNTLSMACGFSAGTFSFTAGGGVKTATEVVSENSKTFRTKQAHEGIIEMRLKELVGVIVQMAELYSVFSGPAGEYDVSVGFDDSIAEDRSAEVTRETELVNNKLQSRKRALMSIHKITELEAEELMAEIDEESISAQQTQLDFFGMQAPVPPGGDEEGGNPLLPGNQPGAPKEDDDEV